MRLSQGVSPASPWGDPYLIALRRQLRRRAAARGALGWLWHLGAPLAAAALMVLPVRAALFPFLDGPVAGYGDGISAVFLRFGLVVAGYFSLEVYDAVLRGSERKVLEHLPVEPSGVVRAALVHLAVIRGWVPVFAAAMWIPVAAQVGIDRLALAALALVGLAAAGAVGGARAYLLAIDMAENPKWNGVLELVRGPNSRAQAALIYAPGAALALLGGAVWVAAEGLRVGGALGVLAALVPTGVALLAWPGLGAAAGRAWYPATAVLADIDGRYAALVDPEEARRVYLDWTVRALPEEVGRHALRDLRAGWRTHRSWISAGWLGGVGAALLGWSGDTSAPNEAATAATLAAFAVGALPSWLYAREPDQLWEWLSLNGLNLHFGRAWAGLLWGQAAVLPLLLTVSLRHGLAQGAAVWSAAEGALVVGVSLAIALGRRGLGYYAPLAAFFAVVWVAEVLR